MGGSFYRNQLRINNDVLLFFFLECSELAVNIYMQIINRECLLGKHIWFQILCKTVCASKILFDIIYASKKVFRCKNIIQFQKYTSQCFLLAPLLLFIVYLMAFSLLVYIIVFIVDEENNNGSNTLFSLTKLYFYFFVFFMLFSLLV